MNRRNDIYDSIFGDNTPDSHGTTVVDNETNAVHLSSLVNDENKDFKPIIPLADGEFDSEDLATKSYDDSHARSIITLNMVAKHFPEFINNILSLGNMNFMMEYRLENYVIAEATIKKGSILSVDEMTSLVARIKAMIEELRLYIS